MTVRILKRTRHAGQNLAIFESFAFAIGVSPVGTVFRGELVETVKRLFTTPAQRHNVHSSLCPVGLAAPDAHRRVVGQFTAKHSVHRVTAVSI